MEVKFYCHKMYDTVGIGFLVNNTSDHSGLRVKKHLMFAFHFLKYSFIMQLTRTVKRPTLERKNGRLPENK
jgi:hypothetical protein